MNNSRYATALLYYERGKYLSSDSEVFLTVVAPATGILLGATFTAFYSYMKRKRKPNLDSPEIIPVTVNSNGNNYSLFRRTLRRVNTTLAGRSIGFAYKKVVTSQFLRIAVSSSFKVIDGIIIVRSVILVKNVFNHYVGTRENLFKVGINTLGWILYSRERELVVNVGFIIITLIIAKLWNEQNLLIQKALRTWVLISFFNLSNYIYINTDVLDYRPSDIGLFGLPKVEHLIKPVNPFIENVKNSKVSMLEKEETLGLSSPIRNEMSKGISDDVELELNKIIQNSTLGEEKIVLSKTEGLQKGKTREVNFNSKSKRRVNSLQKLNETNKDMESLNIENELGKLSNSTKVKAEKVE